MQINLSKAELTILNRVMGYIQDCQTDGALNETADELVLSDEFNELNTKIAELQADAIN